MKGAEFTASLVPLTVSVGAFTAILPEMSDVRRSKNDPQMTTDVRVGEITASVLVMTIGLATSYMTDSAFPAIVSLMCIAVMVAMYEIVLKMDIHPIGKA